MATTKVIKDLTELNPGNPDYVLNATNAVTVINAGGNQYNFNGVYGKFGLRIGTTVLTGVPVAHPIAVLNNGLTGITYTGTFFNTLDVGGVTYNFYTGDVTITVTADFGVASYYCYYHGYMGGENNFVSVYSEAGLKMPSSNAAYSGPTVAEGMMRNEVGQVSESSASTMQHYNGTDWKNFVNKAVISTFNISYLLVGGGGGGGWNIGAGGGAGQYLVSFPGSGEASGGSVAASPSTGEMTTGVAYSITIGTGGAGAVLSGSSTSNGANGLSTVLNFEGRGGGGALTETAIGGGGGGTGGDATTFNGLTGASGGGGSRGNASFGTGQGGSATNTTTGYNGGNAFLFAPSNFDSSAGGGGAFGPAANATGKGGYNGGIGFVSTIDGTSTGRGGGGGSGGFDGAPSIGTGTQGGGNGGEKSSSLATDGAANTGGGGGGGPGSGSDAERSGGTGGSGVVIIRYPAAQAAVLSGGATGDIDQAISGSTDKYAKVTGSGTITFS